MSNRDGARTPTISIVILTWNSSQLITECIGSLENAGWGPSNESTETIIIDNGSTDGTASIVLADFPRVRVIKNSHNRGVAPARNQGMRAARAKHVLLLDCDARVTVGAIERMLEACTPGVGVVGPKLTDEDGTLQYSCRSFPTLLGKVGRRLHIPPFANIAKSEELRHWDHGHICAVDYVIGACQLIYLPATDTVGLLDERIRYGPEDVDFCLRVHRAGYLVVYEPAAVVVHIEQRITRRLKPTRALARHIFGLIYFFAKHRYAFRPPVFPLRDATYAESRMTPPLPRAKMGIDTDSSLRTSGQVQPGPVEASS